MPETKKLEISNAVIENRMGIIRINHEIIEKMTDEELTNLFSNLFVVKSENLFCCKVFEYHAYSSLFEKIDNACAPPEYSVSIENGKIEFHKVESVK